MIDSGFAPGFRWLWEFVPQNNDQIDYLTTITRDQYPKWGKIFTSYPSYVMLAWRASQKLRKESYDLVVAWESDTGFPLGIIRTIIGQKTPKLILLTFSIRGPIVHFKWLQKIGVKGIDYFTVPSRHELNFYSAMLNISPERIFYCPFGAHDIYQASFSPQWDFIYCGGRSGRDYSTFFKAVSDLPIPVILNARPFNLNGLSIPQNVIVNNILPFNQYVYLICGARFVVVPLHNVNEAVGITSVLYAMAAGKAVICTRIPSILDYIQEGKTGLLVSPGDPEEMRSAIDYLWKNPDVAQEFGENARQLYLEEFTYQKFARRTLKIIEEIGKST